MTLQVAALGDSTSCGEGVGLRVPPGQTWPALVAAALPGAALTPLAQPGVRTADVRAAQLGPAVAASPHLATLLVGLNDVSRGRFDAARVTADVLAVVEGLRASGATVLVGRLHDPTRGLPLPGRLRAEVRRRVAAVNAAVDAARAPEVVVLDLAAVPQLRSRSAWAVDRLHPSAAGHWAVAVAAARALRAAGLPVGPVATPAQRPVRPSPVAEARWALRHGLPWLVGHLPEVAVPVLAGRAG